MIDGYTAVPLNLGDLLAGLLVLSLILRAFWRGWYTERP
jgi:hypothetical protein